MREFGRIKIILSGALIEAFGGLMAELISL
jgi:hypothetical protein